MEKAKIEYAIAGVFLVIGVGCMIASKIQEKKEKKKYETIKYKEDKLLKEELKWTIVK